MNHHVRDISQQFWASQRLPYLTIRSTMNSGQGYKPHSHPELSIGIIQAGITNLTINQQHSLLHPNDMILIEPNCVHSCNPVEELPRSYHMLYIDQHWCCQQLSKLYDHPVNQFSCESSPLKASSATWNLLINQLMAHDLDITVHEIEPRLVALIHRYCIPINPAANEDTLIHSVRSKLLEDIIHPPSLDTLAVQIGRTKEAMIRSFKHQFGITPKSFLNNYRVERAKQLLKSGATIVDAAIEVGFSDQSQLHRAFINYTASTPRQYQQAHINFRQ
ncbi:helix-turn-helix domain-containing protein [Vibrio sp. WJH972]